MMYSACKLNKQSDNTQPWRTPFPIWNQSVVPCPVLTVASWPAYRFLKKQVRCPNIPISFRIFQFIVIHTVEGFGIVNKAEIDIFLELSCFFNDPADVGNLISGPSAFSKTSFEHLQLTVHILLKPGLENFKHYFTSMWDECNCVVVWAFFGIAFLWDWKGFVWDWKGFVNFGWWWRIVWRYFSFHKKPGKIIHFLLPFFWLSWSKHESSIYHMTCIVPGGRDAVMTRT